MLIANRHLFQECRNPLKGILVSLPPQDAYAKHVHLVIAVAHGQFLEPNRSGNRIGGLGRLEVAFVQHDRNGDAFYRPLSNESIQFITYLLEPDRIGGVNQKHNGVAIACVILPQMSHGLVSTQVPVRWVAYERYIVSASKDS